MTEFQDGHDKGYRRGLQHAADQIRMNIEYRKSPYFSNEEGDPCTPYTPEQTAALIREAELIEAKASAFCLYCPGDGQHKMGCAVGGKNQIVITVTKKE